MTASGWLFDIYPLADKMVVWIKQENGSTTRLEDNWSHSIYVVASRVVLKSFITDIKEKCNDSIFRLIRECKFTHRYEKIIDNMKRDVLKLTLSDSNRALDLAKYIEKIGAKFGKLRVYNADLPPAQAYLYEHDLFPLVFCKVTVQSSNKSKSKLNWENKDNVWSTHYKVPEFKIIHMSVKQKKASAIPRYSDRISSISITYEDSKSFEIQAESEADVMNNLLYEVAKLDPDFIFTDDGDSFTFPYLIYRAEQQHAMLYDSLTISRDSIPLRKPTREGTSYFSYGRVYFKPTTIKLYGRIHMDKSNSFVWNESGLQGLYEIARICRMPLHTASRASIGKCLSSLQFYYASKKDILIPWKPFIAEHFKTLSELFIADRGGFIFEPKIGVHEKVAEFDFESLYPNIMEKYNLSAETIQCNCCKRYSPSHSDNSKLIVPELDHHICQKRIGIVPTSLKIVLEKRARYRRLKNDKSIPTDIRKIYDARYSALKWILVTSFGYLGFNNAKFGRIDAHIAVCAFDRKILLDTTKIAEQNGFRVLHGIVDSVWLQKKRKHVGEQTEYSKLKELIETKTSFKVSFEGMYKWIVFVHSKTDGNLPVSNRYFGVFEDGSLKIRGIETRRHDTPYLFSKCQNEMLQIMATGNTISEVKALMPKIKDIFYNYVHLLKQRIVPFEELIFTKRLSKNSNEYEIGNTVENNSMQQLLEQEGKSIRAGEILKYVLTSDYYRKQSRRRAIPIELINDKSNYSVRRYTELLAEVCNSVTKPFGYSLELELSLPD